MFKVKGQVNAKEGGKIYTTQSAFLRVLLKQQNISTYEKDLSSAGSWGLDEDFVLCWSERAKASSLKVQFKKKKEKKQVEGTFKKLHFRFAAWNSNQKVKNDNLRVQNFRGRAVCVRIFLSKVPK